MADSVLRGLPLPNGGGGTAATDGLYFPPYAGHLESQESVEGEGDRSQVSEDLLDDELLSDGGVVEISREEAVMNSTQVLVEQHLSQQRVRSSTASPPIAISATPEEAEIMVNRCRPDVDINSLPDVAEALHSHFISLSGVRNTVEVGRGSRGEDVYIVTSLDVEHPPTRQPTAVYNPMLLPLRRAAPRDASTPPPPGYVVYVHKGSDVEPQSGGAHARAPGSTPSPSWGQPVRDLATAAAAAAAEADQHAEEQWLADFRAIVKQSAASPLEEMEWYGVVVPLVLAHRTQAPNRSCRLKAGRLLQQIAEKMHKDIAEVSREPSLKRARSTGGGEAPGTPPLALKTWDKLDAAFEAQLEKILEKTPTRRISPLPKAAPLKFDHEKIVVRQSPGGRRAPGAATPSPIPRTSGQKRKAVPVAAPAMPAAKASTMERVRQYASSMLQELAQSAGSDEEDDDNVSNDARESRLLQRAITGGRPATAVTTPKRLPDARTVRHMATAMEREEHSLLQSLMRPDATPEKEALRQSISEGNQSLVKLATIINTETGRASQGSAGRRSAGSAAPQQLVIRDSQGSARRDSQDLKKMAKAPSPAKGPVLPVEDDVEEDAPRSVKKRRAAPSVTRQLEGSKPRSGGGNDDDEDAESAEAVDMADQIMKISQKLANTPRTKERIRKSALQHLTMTPVSASQRSRQTADGDDDAVASAVFEEEEEVKPKRKSTGRPPQTPPRTSTSGVKKPAAKSGGKRKPAAKLTLSAAKQRAMKEVFDIESSNASDSEESAGLSKPTAGKRGGKAAAKAARPAPKGKAKGRR